MVTLLLLSDLHMAVCFQETADGEIAILHDFHLGDAFPAAGINEAPYQQLRAQTNNRLRLPGSLHVKVRLLLWLLPWLLLWLLPWLLLLLHWGGGCLTGGTCHMRFEHVHEVGQHCHIQNVAPPPLLPLSDKATTK